MNDFFHEGKIHSKIGLKLIHFIGRSKLDILYCSHALDDLFSPPGNSLEELKGNLKGIYNIRTNNQWSIIFQWTEKSQTEVDNVDYQ